MIPPSRNVPVVVLLAAALLASGCAPRITRIAPEQAIDLSGRWNDVDSRLVADAIEGRPEI